MKKFFLLGAMATITISAKAQSVDTTKVDVVDTVKIEQISPMVNVYNTNTTRNCELMPPTHTTKVYPRDPQAPIQPILPGTPANYGVEMDNRHELYDDKKE